MTDAIKTPWHLWVVGGLSLLWNVFPAIDFTLTTLRSDFWLSQYTPEQLAFVVGAPAWSNICWALGGFGSLLGSVLLLARSRHALTAFLISAIGLLGVTYYQLVQNGAKLKELLGDVPLYFTVTIWVILLALIIYTRAMKKRGVLR